MRIGVLLAVWLAGASCLNERTIAEPQVAQPVIRGLENADLDIQEHFSDLLAEGFESMDEGDGALSGYEKFVVFDTGSELRMYLLVHDGTGYDIAVEVAVDNSLDVAIGEEVELTTTVLRSNAELLDRAARLAGIRQQLEDGVSLSSLAISQVRLQEDENTGSVSAPSSSPVAVAVSCAGSGTAVCCGFVSGCGVRVICVCNTGSNRWILCFDSKCM